MGTGARFALRCDKNNSERDGMSSLRPTLTDGERSGDFVCIRRTGGVGLPIGPPSIRQLQPNQNRLSHCSGTDRTDPSNDHFVEQTLSLFELQALFDA